MPKRKTAEANVDVSASAAKSRKAAATSTTHKRTITKRAIQPSDVSGTVAAAPAVQPATEIVASGVTEAIPVRAFVPPTHDDIARLAYSYFEARGYQPGNTTDDWFRAERELLELAQNR